jgi:RHH-type rel operon transcriptional repressor/antitoxin RelB
LTNVSKGIKMTIAIRLDKDLEERFNALAIATGRTKTFYLRELIENGLDDIEDYYLASAAVERIRKGEEKIFSSKDIRKDLGLDN